MDEVIGLFNEHAVRYLLIGGQAVRLEGMPRFSMDWDFYIPPRDQQNIDRINGLLAEEIDVPLLPLGEKGQNVVQTYQLRSGILQFHLGGPGLPPFDEAAQRAVRHKTEGGTEVACMCSQDLLEAKRHANRAEDQADIRFLEKKAESGWL
jgi:hypothetical protein